MSSDLYVIALGTDKVRAHFSSSVYDLAFYAFVCLAASALLLMEVDCDLLLLAEWDCLLAAECLDVLL